MSERELRVGRPSGSDEAGKYNDFSPEMAFHFEFVGSEVPLPDTAARRAQGKRTLMYTANTSLRPNAFIFSKPMESRMLPWLVKKYGFDGSTGGRYIPACIDYLAGGEIRVQTLISAVAPAEEGPEWSRKLYGREADLMKVVLRPS